MNVSCAWNVFLFKQGRILWGCMVRVQILWLIKVSDKFYWLGLFALDMALQA